MAKRIRKKRGGGKQMMPLPVKKQEEFLPPSIKEDPKKEGEFSVSWELFLKFYLLPSYSQTIYTIQQSFNLLIF